MYSDIQNFALNDYNVLPKKKSNKRQHKNKLITELISSVTTKGEGVVSLPVCPARGSSFVVQVSPAT
jgi:hypothetical protein